MERHPEKNKHYQFDTEGEMEVQQQIMQSYQSGVVDQTESEQTGNQNEAEKNQNQLR